MSGDRLTSLGGIPPLYTLPPAKINIKYSYKVPAQKKIEFQSQFSLILPFFLLGLSHSLSSCLLYTSLSGDHPPDRRRRQHH